jgi:hypothetical protein
MPSSLKIHFPRALVVAFFVSTLGGHAWFSQRMGQLAAMPPADDESIGWESASDYTYSSWVVHRRALVSFGPDAMGAGHSVGFVMLSGMKPWPQRAFLEFASPSSLVIPPPLRQLGGVSLTMMGSSSTVVWPRWELVRLMDALALDDEDPSRVSEFRYRWNFRDGPSDRSQNAFSVFDVAPETRMTWKLEIAPSDHNGKSSAPLR